jgi:hypothetical protein
MGGIVDILAAIKREEKKLEKQLDKLQHQLNGVRAAAKALGDSTSKELKVVLSQNRRGHRCAEDQNRNALVFHRTSYSHFLVRFCGPRI